MGQGVSVEEDLALGGRLEDRYHLQKVMLGQGSFGKVWRGVDKRSNEVVAIKQIGKASLRRWKVSQQSIEREIRMMSACHHENLLRFFDSFETQETIFLALEYCDGGDFGDKIVERAFFLEEAEAAEWMRQLCSAVAALHAKGICHRDIKPDNFMVANGTTLKLADFGLAVFATPNRLLKEKCGTPAFMPPEVHLMPDKSPGYWLPIDMWAAGCVFYMLMFGGRHPFLNARGELDRQVLVAGEVPDLLLPDTQPARLGQGSDPSATIFGAEARTLCGRMLAPNPKNRIRAADALCCPWLPSPAVRKRPGGPSPGRPPPPPPRTGEEGSAAVLVPPPRSPSPPAVAARQQLSRPMSPGAKPPQSVQSEPPPQPRSAWGSACNLAANHVAATSSTTCAHAAGRARNSNVRTRAVSRQVRGEHGPEEPSPEWTHDAAARDAETQRVRDLRRTLDDLTHLVQKQEMELAQHDVELARLRAKPANGSGWWCRPVVDCSLAEDNACCLRDGERHSARWRQWQ